MGNISKLDSICVLILNYQSYEDTIKYVGYLQKQENIDLNILIVDNCSPNGSYEILHNTFKDISNVEVIKSEKNGGYAYGNNFGLRYLENKTIDYIIVSNNDILLDDPFLVHNLIQKYQELKNPAFVAPLMYTNGEISKLSAWKIPTFWDDIVDSLRITTLLFGNKTQYKFTNKDYLPMAVDCLSGAFFMGKKEVYFDLNLMDENTFLYGEEVILAKKVKDLGLQNYLIPSLKYKHIDSGTISSQLSQFKMRNYLTQSRMYYHKYYFGVSKLKANFLKLLLLLWKLETVIYRPLKKLISYIKK